MLKTRTSFEVIRVAGDEQLITMRMAVQLLQVILITTTTITITNLAYGELFVKMPLTINPIVQDAITGRNIVVQRLYPIDPAFFSRLTPADIVMTLNNVQLLFVMRSTIAGALVLGAAAKSAGLKATQLNYNPSNKWTVNISLTDIESVLNASEKHLLPLSDNITLIALQNLGLRVLEKQFNVSLGRVSKSLSNSTARTFQSIQEDWIRVVKFITKTNVDRLAGKYEISVSALADALNSSASELYDMTLEQLAELLATKFEYVKGSLKVLVPTVATSTVQTTSDTTTPLQTTNEIPTTSLQETTQTQSTTKVSGEPSTVSRSAATTIGGNQMTTEVDRPTDGSSTGGKDSINLALFVGAPGALLLLLVGSLALWCLKRKRRGSGNSTKKKKEKKNNKNDNVKMNNFWVEKNDAEVPPISETFVRRLSGINGLDSRFKGLKYVPTSASFAPEPPPNPISPRIDFQNDYRREIFV